LQGSEKHCVIVTKSAIQTEGPTVNSWMLCYVGPCHHGMVHPQVADGGRQGVVLELGGWVRN